MAAKQAMFGPGLLKFLKELSRNNEKAWFEKNKARYEAEVREPALELIRAFRPRLARISPHFVASDRKVGGSMMRIYRDVRFSKDKSPYKTNLGIQFRHEAGKDVHAPGFYFHVDPTDCFLGAGMWHPESGALKAVREAIAADRAGWKKVRDGKAFRNRWDLRGDSLKRAPKGFDPEDPMIEDLRRKDHIAVADLDPEILTSPDLLKTLTDHFRAAKPYMAFQAKALKLPI
jgi:uncharacterized protein (TIGR02453 family)